MDEAPEEFRRQAVQWAATLTDKEFVEFFYEAVRGRATGDTRLLPGLDGHFVLGDAQRYDSEPPGSERWYVQLMALPREGDRWAADAAICQSGTCRKCGQQVRSWAKDLLCPVCGTSGYGT